MPRQDDAQSVASQRALARLRNHNQALSACKGLGKIQIRTPHQTQSAQLAWLCKLPDKMRLEIVAPTGHSMLTLSLDGRHVYILPHLKGGKLQKKRVAHLNLKHIIDIPVESDEIMQFLAGRIPLRGFDAVEIDTAPDGGQTLELRKAFLGTVQTVYYDAPSRPPARVVYRSGFWHKTTYTVTFDNYRRIEGFEIPGEIVFTGEGLTATFSIRRYWANPVIPDDRFVITDPETDAANNH